MKMLSRFKLKAFSPLFFFFLLVSPLFSQWQRVASFPSESNIEYVWCLAQTSVFENGSLANYQFAGTSGGVFISNTYGNFWMKINTGLNANGSDLNILSIIARGETIYAGGWGGVFRSPHLGIQWTSIGDYNNGLSVYAVNSIAINDPVILAAPLSAGVFRSTNGGTSWGAINNGLPKPLLPSINQLYLAAPYVFAATSNGVFVNPNNSTQWYYAGSGIPTSTAVYCLVKTGQSTLLAGIINGVYRSDNMGTNWTQVPNAPVTAFQSFAVYDNYIFAGTMGGGIYLSSDAGWSWTKVTVGSGIEYGTVYSLAVLGNYLMAGTYQQGVWRRPLSEMIGSVSAEENNLPAGFDLSQNYPNPFNAETKIKYSIAVKSKITLFVYNTLGQTVAHLIDEVKSPGTYSVSFNGNNLPSGVYNYKYSALSTEGFNNYTAVKKMILLK